MTLHIAAHAVNAAKSADRFGDEPTLKLFEELSVVWTTETLAAVASILLCGLWDLTATTSSEI